MGTIDIAVECADALSFRADVLALKYATALHGVDRAVVGALSTHVPEIRMLLPKPSEFFATATGGSIAASNVLFVGVEPLPSFRYGEIRSFARMVLEISARETPRANHVALTVHGPNYGLDEAEAFESEVAGLLDAINSGNFPPALVKLTVVEIDAGRARRRLQICLVIFFHMPTAIRPFVRREHLGLGSRHFRRLALKRLHRVRPALPAPRIAFVPYDCLRQAVPPYRGKDYRELANAACT